MENIINNKKGVSLVEIVATVAIVSISLIMIYNILSFNIRQNGINQERIINANIANSSLSYIKNRDFADIRTFLDTNNSGYYAVINLNSCYTLFNDDQSICETILSPEINNKQFDDSNLNIYLFPYNDPDKLNLLKSTPPVYFPEIINTYLASIDTSSYNIVDNNPNVIRVVVVVNSTINSRYDFILEEVTTSDQ